VKKLFAESWGARAPSQSEPSRLFRRKPESAAATQRTRGDRNDAGRGARHRSSRKNGENTWAVPPGVKLTDAQYAA